MINHIVSLMHSILALFQLKPHHVVSCKSVLTFSSTLCCRAFHLQVDVSSGDDGTPKLFVFSGASFM